MLFNSLPFLIFFVIVTVLYFVLLHKVRWLLLLIASCVFYMFFKPVYILILAFTIVVDYFAGILLESEKNMKRRKKFLIMSIVANVSILAVFKYYNFLDSSVTGLAALFHWHIEIPYLTILLPIGLSFHTFQAMSYTIEVYRGKQAAEKHFGIYALYVMFYPQLVAGPIERPQNLLHQFREKHPFSSQNLIDGLRLMLWGFFKKVVIADRVSQYANTVFNHPGDYHFGNLIIAVSCFAIQIYADFSGYSDIAIGAARTMGFDLMINFNRPYQSKSITEFWKRWHISLSTWFKDYVYIPLGGNKVGIPKWYFNLFIVFLISGLWHGANWTFILWGALHGFYLIFALLTEKARNKIISFTRIDKVKWLYNPIQVITTFSLVTLAWIFFRGNSVSDVGLIIKHIFTMYHRHPFQLVLKDPSGAIAFTKSALLISILMIGFIVYMESKVTPLLKGFNRRPVLDILFMTLVSVLIILFGVFQNSNFIYFQF